MINLSKFFKSLKIKTQFTIIEITLILFSLAISTIICKIFFKIFIDTLRDSFISGFQKQDADQIIIGALYFKHFLNQQNQQIVQQLQSVDSFTELFDAEQKKITINIQNEPCLPYNYLFQFNTFFFIPRFCYQVDSVPDFVTIPSTDYNAIMLNQIISILNQYSLLFDSLKVGWFLQIVALSNSLYFSQYPFMVQVPGFNITNLTWYQNHMRVISQDPQLKISHSIFESEFFKGVLEITTVYSLWDSNNNTVGVAKQSLSITNTTFPSIPYNILLISQEGEVIYQNIGMIFDIWIPKSQDQIIYIYNQSQTGFDKQDWQAILENTNTTNSISLYSKLYNQTIQIKSYYFANQNYTLLVYSNITNNEFLLSQIELATNTINAEILSYTIFIIICTVIFLIIGYIGLHYIFKPITYISSIQNNQINVFENIASLEIYQLILNKQFIQNNQLKILQNTVINLQEQFNKRQFIKSNYCQLHENYYFPKTVTFSFSQIINQNLNNILDTNIQTKNIQDNIHQFLDTDNSTNFI